MNLPPSSQRLLQLHCCLLLSCFTVTDLVLLLLLWLRLLLLCLAACGLLVCLRLLVLPQLLPS